MLIKNQKEKLRLKQVLRMMTLVTRKMKKLSSIQPTFRCQWIIENKLTYKHIKCLVAPAHISIILFGDLVPELLELL